MHAKDFAMRFARVFFLQFVKPYPLSHAVAHPAPDCRQENIGAQQPMTLTAAHGRALYFMELGRDEEALQWFQEVLLARTEVKNPRGPK